jgi:FKBP-type peptidyl-prolyl cis-trans isomerase
MASLLLMLMLSCVETPGKKDIPGTTASLHDSVIAFNREIVTSEKQEIDDYVARHRWTMTKTQTGLQFMIYRRGSGQGVPVMPSEVNIKYCVYLLNGDLVYETDSIKGFSFETGKRNVVSGLEEGVRLMKTGDRAKLIVPSHLAFGLLGDLAKIPARAVLVYDVELCSINPLKK